MVAERHAPRLRRGYNKHRVHAKQLECVHNIVDHVLQQRRDRVHALLRVALRLVGREEGAHLLLEFRAEEVQVLVRVHDECIDNRPGMHPKQLGEHHMAVRRLCVARSALGHGGGVLRRDAIDHVAKSVVSVAPHHDGVPLGHHRPRLYDHRVGQQCRAVDREDEERRGQAKDPQQKPGHDLRGRVGRHDPVCRVRRAQHAPLFDPVRRHTYPETTSTCAPRRPQRGSAHSSPSRSARASPTR